MTSILLALVVAAIVFGLPHCHISLKIYRMVRMIHPRLLTGISDAISSSCASWTFSSVRDADVFTCHVVANPEASTHGQAT